MTTPNFHPDVPAPLLHGVTPKERWMFEQLSIQRQQNEWIMKQLAIGDARFDQADKSRAAVALEVSQVAARIAVIERIKDRLTARWSVVVVLLASILGPLALAFIGALFTRWIEKRWP